METVANLHKHIVITAYVAYSEHGNVLPTRKSERLFGVDCGVTPAVLRTCDLLPKFSYLHLFVVFTVSGQMFTFMQVFVLFFSGGVAVI